jgi:murein DD-endopeptidase MepM/ murein hydrolase activator NlpD
MTTRIVNNFQFPVILDDNRDPNVSWQNHLARGSAGGVDLAFPYGTAIKSPADGRLVADDDPDGSGGRMAILYIDHDVLSRIEFLHLADAFDGNVSIGGGIGLSGASGFGSNWGYAQHLHVHAYDKAGRRVNLWNYWTPDVAAVVTSLLGPVIRSGADWAYRRPQGDLAKRIARALIARGRLASNYPNDGLPGAEFDKGIQRTLVASSVFASSIDGVIERGGSYGIQDYAIKFTDYERYGVRDGRPEMLSWTKFAEGLEAP